MPSPYTEVSQDEEKLLQSNEPSDDGSSLDLRRPGQPSILKRASRLSSALHWLAHGTTIVLLFILLVRQKPNAPETEELAELYSPAYANSKRPLHYETFKTEFWEKTGYKAYPGSPTKEQMAKWHHLTKTPALNLTADELSRLGLSTDSVQWPKNAGGGYIGYLESAHQLHCLEALWTRHHFDKDPTNPIFAHQAEKMKLLPDIEEAHLEHCVDVLRQRLMCTADASIVTFRWVKGLSSPYPNFHTTHRCASYEGLLGWAEERKADMGKVKGWDYRFREEEGTGTEIDYLP